MNEETKKLLTEYLGKCWHHWVVANPEDHITDFCMRGHKCYYCGEYSPVQPGSPGPLVKSTYDNRSDMMDLFQAIFAKGEWEEFCKHTIGEWESRNDYVDKEIPDFTAWLLCLSGEGYAERYQMVADWIEER